MAWGGPLFGSLLLTSSQMQLKYAFVRKILIYVPVQSSMDVIHIVIKIELHPH